MFRLGTDIVYIPRIRQLVEKFGQRFLNRVYTADELLLCGLDTYDDNYHRQNHGVNQEESPKQRLTVEKLAGRWAAKEAVVKALGTGWCGIGYTDVEICRHPNGIPFIKLHNNAAMIVAGWGKGAENEQLSFSSSPPMVNPQWQISLSHDGDYAIATAILIVSMSAI